MTDDKEKLLEKLKKDKEVIKSVLEKNGKLPQSINGQKKPIK